MDLRLPDMSGIDATVAIRREFPEARIIILTQSTHDPAYRPTPFHHDFDAPLEIGANVEGVLVAQITVLVSRTVT